MATTPTLDLIGIVVKDMAAALRFYRLLGLAIPDGAEAEDHVEITLSTGLRIAWDTVSLVQSFDPTWTPPSGGHAMGLAFLCASPAEVDSTHAALVAQGYTSHKAPWDAFWGQRYAQVSDPDGNVIDLFAPLSGA